MPINRRRFIQSLSASIAIPSIHMMQSQSSDSISAPHPARKPRRPPNVILMICDDLGYGDLGCYGSELPTPHIDALASAGMRFTRCNAGHPICSASRAALLTGRYGLRSGTTGAFGPHSRSGTSLDETLLSNLFHDAGYATKAVGKWHLGSMPEYLPTSRGFDSFYGVPYSVSMKPLPLLRDTTVLEQDTDRNMLTPRYTKEALKYIEERDDKPFFLYLAYSYPHDPALASKRFRGRTALGDYGDSIAEIDWSVGEIVRAVEKKGIASDTLIFFTSDHGPWYQGNPGMLRGRKASTFEGGFRVPLIAQWTGTITPGRVASGWYSNLDILPSLSTVCGLGRPVNPLDGIDASKVFLGGDEEVIDQKPRLYFFPMGDHGIDLHCIRKENWKLRLAQGVRGEIYLNDRTTQAKGSEWLQNPELYNLALDPTESYDVAKFHPEIVETLSGEDIMASFPPRIREAFSSLKQKKGGISTPPGASPRPFAAPLPDTDWGPEGRRPR